MEQIIVTHVDNTTIELRSKERGSNITNLVQNVGLLGVDTVDITVESCTKLEFYIGDKITVIGKVYTLNQPAEELKISEQSFVYTLQFEGVQYDLLRANFSVNVDTTNSEIQDISGDSLTGDFKLFLDVIIANANRVFPGKWALGTYPSSSETRTETFSENDNCLSVLQSLCSEDKYSTEFKITSSAGVNTINIGDSGSLFPYTFEHGKGLGFYNLARKKVSSSNIITRLNVYGGSRNIITSKYRASKLCLPNKNKAQSYLEASASIASYGIWEYSKTFEEIYPEREGVVTSLGGSELLFTDATFDFDLNAKDINGNTIYLIEGVSAKVKFNTGNLAGYDFELASYDHTTKSFKLIKFTDENGFVFPSPSSSAFQVAVGDKYVITDIALPQSYVDSAELRLQSAGQDYLDKYSSPRVSYTLTIDKFFLQRLLSLEVESNIFWVGDYIQIRDTDIVVDGAIKITGFTRNLLDEYPNYTNITISDQTVSVTIITRVITELKGLSNIIRINNLTDAAKARRNWLAAQEVLSMVFDTEGHYYSEKIKPLSVETTMLSVGAKSQQFGLIGTIFQPNYLGNKNRIVYTGGILAHYAIIDSNNNPRFWNIADGDITLPTDEAYYIYAKCQVVGTAGSILFSTAQIIVDSDVNFYHFLIGVVNSVDSANARALALTYGFTTINGRFIRTGRIQNPDGSTYFDLDSGEIGGVIKFIDQNGDYKDIDQLNQDLIYFIEATNLIQNQIDGKVDTWFYNYAPTLNNEPASNWINNAQKDEHLSDLFFDKSTEKAYRFIKANSIYAWSEVGDAGIAKALLTASKAQDTADGKRRVFTSEPYPPYDLGDLWTQGGTGDIMVCIVSKSSGNYLSTDWDKASKYTDDSTINDFISNIFGNYVDTTQAQIDGKIEAWFQDSDPNIWAVGERAKHDKDMWYKLTEKKLYRYKASDNSWQRIEDADAIAAYEAASKAQDTADGKRRIFVSTPYPPYDVGDLWTDGNHLFRCVTAKVEGESYNPIDWNYATFYDNTKTVIDGGIVTSGRIQLAGDDSNIKAGITGQGVNDDSVRFWAGTSYENRAIAQCRILQSGKAFFREAVILTNEYNQEQGGICGDAGSTTDGIRAFFGSTYSSRSIAPCRIYSDGSLVATKGNIGNFQIDNGNLKNTDGSATIISQATNNGNNTQVTIGRNYNNQVIGGRGFGPSNLGAFFKSEGNDTDNPSNIAAVFEASGASFANISMYAKLGDSIHNRFLANGMAWTDITSSTSIDPSQYETIRVNSTSEITINFVTSTYYRSEINVGKEITFINLDNGVDMLLPATIGDSYPRRFEGGSVVTYKYAGVVAGAGRWFIKSFFNNDF